MELSAFPFDSERCELTFESFTYNNAEVQMVWKDSSPVGMLNEVLRAQSYPETQSGNSSYNSSYTLVNLMLADYELVRIDNSRKPEVIDFIS